MHICPGSRGIHCYEDVLKVEELAILAGPICHHGRICYLWCVLNHIQLRSSEVSSSHFVKTLQAWWCKDTFEQSQTWDVDVPLFGRLKSFDSSKESSVESFIYNLSRGETSHQNVEIFIIKLKHIICQRLKDLSLLNWIKVLKASFSACHKVDNWMFHS